MNIWAVPITPAYPEGEVYSLVYVSEGKRIIGYDNEHHGTGKSNHHKHLRNKIMPYPYKDMWAVISDFMDDVEKLRKGEL